jgi:hypothetical protein
VDERATSPGAPRPRGGRAAGALALAVPVVVAGVAWRGILGNYFHADDFVDLYHVVAYGLGDYLTETHGGHVDVVRNALYVVYAHLFGMRPSRYFAVVIANHVLNVGLLVAVIRTTTARPVLAALVGLLWGTAPMLEGTIGWLSVHGQVVAATILLAVLADVAQLAAAGRDVSLGRAAVWWIVLLAGTTCFGVGIGVAAAFPLAAWLLLGRALRPRPLALLACLPPAALALYAACNVIHVQVYGDSAEVVMYQVAMLRWWRPIVAMLVHLVGAGVAELVVGGTIGVSGYPGPLALAAVGACALLLAAAAVRRPDPDGRRIGAMLLVAVAAYAVIAAGRANLYLQFPTLRDPARAAMVARYHYLATLPLAIALATALAAVRVPRALAVAAAVLATVVRVRHGLPIDHHDGDRAAVGRVLDAIRYAIMATPPGDDVYIRNHAFPPAAFVAGPRPGAFPGWAAVFILFYDDNVVGGRRVRFVVPDPRTLAAAAASPSRRVATLLVPDAPPGPVF